MKKLAIFILAVFAAHLCNSQNFDDKVTITQKDDKYPSLHLKSYQGLHVDGHSSLFMQNYGGTPASPGFTPAGKILGNITFAGHDGIRSVQAGRIHVSATGDFSDGSYPTKMFFKLGGSASCCGINRMVIDGTNGNVGIGTSEPGQVLDLERNTNGSAFLEVTNTNNGTNARRGIILGNGTEGNAVSLFSTSANYNPVPSWANSGVLSTQSQLSNGIIVRTTAGDVRFQPGGAVDKASINQSGKLSLVNNKGALGDILSLYGDRFDQGNMYGFGIETNGGILYSKAVSGYNWYVNNNADQGSSAMMKLNENALEVDGKVRAEEVKVEVINWSDFVFYPDYQLRSLSEVEKFIDDNQHLPDIPSEQEVLENGIELSKMNAKLLQKIEELTLYLIEQNKKIEELERKIESK
ncbi:MAG: hypothetical protein AAFQ94_11510 [Bacteroidota bacterium]